MQEAKLVSGTASADLMAEILHRLAGGDAVVCIPQESSPYSFVHPLLATYRIANSISSQLTARRPVVRFVLPITSLVVARHIVLARICHWIPWDSPPPVAGPATGHRPGRGSAAALPARGSIAPACSLVLCAGFLSPRRPFHVLDRSQPSFLRSRRSKEQ